MEARKGGELEKDGGGPHLFFIHKLSHVVSQAKRKSLLRSFLMGNTIHTRYVLLHTCLIYIHEPEGVWINLIFD